MADYEGVPPEVAMLATHLRHVQHVAEAMTRIRQDLELRILVHDRSKLGPEELPGFCRINATARQHAFGSSEYRASIKAERPTVERHITSNSHHPEAHQPLSSMGFLDIVEMVCDWWGANKAYGNTSWEEALTIQRGRLGWSPEQWWLIEQVAAWLARHG